MSHNMVMLAQRIAPSGGGGGGNITVDLWSPMETASPDATTLKAAATGGAVASSSWLCTGSQATSTSAERATISTVNTVADTGTYGYRGNHNTPNRVRIDLNTYPTTQSTGFWYQCTVLDNNTYTQVAGLGESEAPSAVIALVRVENNGGTYTIFLSHSGGNSGTITISAATFYWVTVKYIQNGTCSISVFNTSGSQVGSTQTLAGQNKSPFYHNFGCLTSLSGSGDDYIDDYVIDKTTAAFPLGP